MSDRERVARELGSLCALGGLLNPASPRATVNSYADGELAMRLQRFSRAFLSHQPDVPTEGLAVVTAGVPGAGKSTLMREYGFDGPSWRSIDADDVKSLILRDARASGTLDDLLAMRLADGRPILLSELSGLVHQESLAVTDAVTRYAIRRGENVVIQGTLGWAGQGPKLLTRFRAAKYDSLAIKVVEVQKPVAISRAADRWWNGRENLSEGDRFIPEHLFDELYVSGSSSICAINAEEMFTSSDVPETSIEAFIAGAPPTKRYRREGSFLGTGAEEALVAEPDQPSA